ncbi:MAG: hypothetical protein LBM04_02125, partial [Opitutaceae bacterium]|nr:hypothetical protein [Opitutaceae bacterium]
MKTLRLPAFATAALATAASFAIALASAPLHAQPVSDEASAPPVDFPALSLNDTDALTATPVDLQTSGGIQEELVATGTEVLADSGTALPTATNYFGATTKSRQGAISVQSMTSAPLFSAASVSGTTIWNDNNYPLTLSIRMPRNAPCLFENQIFTLPARVGDRTTLGDFNSHVTAWKWEVSTDSGRNWEAVADFTDADSTPLISGTENPLYLPLNTGMAGWQYRVTADVGPTLRNDDPVVLVSNTVTLPEIKLSHITSPASLAIDTAGNLYVADTHDNAIWKITGGNKISLLAGSATHEPGTLDGTGTAARFNSPFGITLHGGKLYVADTRNHAIRVIDTASGVVSTLAGVPGEYEYGYAEGTGTGARFDTPTAIAADAAGNLYVADGRNTIIRKITPAGVTSHVAGTRYDWGSGVGGSASMYAFRYADTMDMTFSGSNLIFNVATGTMISSDSNLFGTIATGGNILIWTGSDWSGGYFSSGTFISTGTAGIILGKVGGGTLVSGTDLGTVFTGSNILTWTGSDWSRGYFSSGTFISTGTAGVILGNVGGGTLVSGTDTSALSGTLSLRDSGISQPPDPEVFEAEDEDESAPYYFNYPYGLVVSPSGDALWVADTYNNNLCKINLA